MIHYFTVTVISSQCSGWSFPTNFFYTGFASKHYSNSWKIIIAKLLQQVNPCVAILKKFAERESRSLINFNHFGFHNGVSTKFVESGKKHDTIKKKQKQKNASTTTANRKWLIVRNWNGGAKGSNIFQKVVKMISAQDLSNNGKNWQKLSYQKILLAW